MKSSDAVPGRLFVDYMTWTISETGFGCRIRNDEKRTVPGEIRSAGYGKMNDRTVFEGSRSAGSGMMNDRTDAGSSCGCICRVKQFCLKISGKSQKRSGEKRDG